MAEGFDAGAFLWAAVHPEMTVPQAADFLGLTPGRVRALCQREQLQARKVGRDWLIREDAVKAWAAQPHTAGRPSQETIERLKSVQRLNPEEMLQLRQRFNASIKRKPRP